MVRGDRGRQRSHLFLKSRDAEPLVDTVNGSFLAAGLIDEVSLVLAPVADGTVGSPTVFDVRSGNANRMAAGMTLQSVRRLNKDALWLRYKGRKQRPRK